MVTQDDLQALREEIANLRQQILDLKASFARHQLGNGHYGPTLSECPARFNGEDPERVYTFLLEIEDYCIAEDIDDDVALRSVAVLLEDAARTWWHAVRDDLHTWAAFKIAFKANFQPKTYDYEVMDKISARLQGPSETISIFIVVIKCLYRQMAQPPTEEKQVQRTIYNLHPKYKPYLHLSTLRTFADLREQGQFAEAILESNKRFRAIQKASTSQPDAATKMSKSSKRCAFCRYRGHVESECRKKQAASAATHPVTIFTVFRNHVKPLL